MNTPSHINNSEWGVSVIIPAYNYARFLPAAIDSALNQNHNPLEVIVVDDGSTDNTPEVALQYGSRIRYIRQDNAGLPAARNTGISNASYPFVAFLDADDQWLPTRLHTGMTLFKELPDTYAIVACLSDRINQNGEKMPLNKAFWEMTGEVSALDILLMTRFMPSTAIARRKAFDGCGMFDTSLRSSEDRDMWIRIAARWRVHVQDQRLVLIRKHAENMSSNAGRMKENMGRVIRKAWANRVVAHYRLDYWLQVLAIWRYQTALIYLGGLSHWDAFKDIALSLCCWPIPMSCRRISSSIGLIRLRTLARIFLSFRDQGGASGKGAP